MAATRDTGAGGSTHRAARDGRPVAPAQPPRHRVGHRARAATGLRRSPTDQPPGDAGQHCGPGLMATTRVSAPSGRPALRACVTPRVDTAPSPRDHRSTGQGQVGTEAEQDRGARPAQHARRGDGAARRRRGGQRRDPAADATLRGRGSSSKPAGRRGAEGAGAAPGRLVHHHPW